MTITTRTRRRIGAMLVMAALLVGSVAFGGTATAATQVQIGTFNMAGGHQLSDDTPGHGAKGDEAPDALVASIRDRSPAFVVVQEACDDWMQRVAGQLPDYAVAFDAVASADGSTPSCKHPNSQFGNAIVYRRDFGVDDPGPDPEGHDLQTPQTDPVTGAATPRERREMLCVAASARNAVVCSIHLTNGSSEADAAARRVEIETATTILATTYAGATVFLGGDLNAEPGANELGPLYHMDYGDGATGQFKEVDSPCGNDIAESTTTYIGENPVAVPCRDGESTHDDVWTVRDWLPDIRIEEGPLSNKIDHVFVSPSVEVLSADATTGIHSDHDPLWADVVF